MLQLWFLIGMLRYHEEGIVKMIHAVLQAWRQKAQTDAGKECCDAHWAHNRQFVQACGMRDEDGSWKRIVASPGIAPAPGV